MSDFFLVFGCAMGIGSVSSASVNRTDTHCRHGARSTIQSLVLSGIVHALRNGGRWKPICPFVVGLAPTRSRRRSWERALRLPPGCGWRRGARPAVWESPRARRFSVAGGRRTTPPTVAAVIPAFNLHSDRRAIACAGGGKGVPGRVACHGIGH